MSYLPRCHTLLRYLNPIGHMATHDMLSQCIVEDVYKGPALVMVLALIPTVIMARSYDDGIQY